MISTAKSNDIAPRWNTFLCKCKVHLTVDVYGISSKESVAAEDLRRLVDFGILVDEETWD
jgi:hypothetical protein